MDKTIERMRADPQGDWQIADVEKACREVGVQYRKPSSGAHFKIGNQGGGTRLTIPAGRPIKPVYIKMLVAFLDRMDR